MKAELLYESPAHGPAAGHERAWDRILARALAPSLDRQLAAGRPPRSSNALAIRARDIVSLATRQELAQLWANVLDQASRPPVPRSPRAPLRRTAVAAAERELREMIWVLAGREPVDARGAAMASLLLSDGAGPLYNHRSPADLGAAAREATRQMNSLAAPRVHEISSHARCRR
jgi:hypothetical protein